MTKPLYFLQRRKYELLLAALVQHLFIAIGLQDLTFYTRVVWPINMVILGVASVGVFVGKGRWKNGLRNGLLVVVVLLPLSLPFVGQVPEFMKGVSLLYVVFFGFILGEILQFLLKPGYINADLISASACGYFLLLEVSVFLMQTVFYQNPASFKGIDTSHTAAAYLDFVYFSAITLTSIGFGDITPATYPAKLLIALVGIAGQFYSVVLVGILISKFTAGSKT